MRAIAFSRARSPLPSAAIALIVSLSASPIGAQANCNGCEKIPLPEHPRPDFHRAAWLNLNGTWRFRTDAADAGTREEWQAHPLASPRRILVPFSWAAPLSGIGDSANIGWYERTIEVPRAWRGKRIFLVVGASDWRTSAWLDGEKLGDHQGGYTPFEFELTPRVRFAGQRLTLRVDDTAHPFKLEGKQGYGQARGIWQTVYLEARGAAPVASVHFTPDIDRNLVTVDVRLAEPAGRDVSVRTRITNRIGQPSAAATVGRGSDRTRFTIALPDARRWSLEDPFLHEATVIADDGSGAPDRVDTYFGMRKISVMNLPGTTIPYVALNNSPLYLQLTLDQAYHPTGFYTFPTDSFTRMEILRARQIGLNGLREHIKIETPRKLYWADKLGVLIMADVPNWWGAPDSAAFQEHETAMRGMIDRDYNHPAIFSWVMFNEAWGLTTKTGDREVYLPATQQKVAAVQRLAKSLDPTRLVEDNSPCCGRGHTVTDLNSWHEYLPGWRWRDYMRVRSDSTFPGSTWNFERGYKQDRQPMFNSEFGNVWGYDGSTGDVDWSWDYHLAINEFRRNPILSGWLYTEHHDVINEWNGYWRFDRTSKETGLGEFIRGMSLRDLHAPLYVVVGDEMGRKSAPGEKIDVSLWASFLSGNRGFGDSLVLRTELSGWNALGEKKTWQNGRRMVKYRPWMSESLAPLTVTMPNEAAVAVLSARLESRAGVVLGRNFTTFVVDADPARNVTLADGRRGVLARVDASAHTAARWSRKMWTAMDGLKVNGAGSGFFEYRIPWPAGVSPTAVAGATFIVEASAKQLFGKDRSSGDSVGGDFMRGGGSQDPSRNPNAYPMTDERKYPSVVTIRVNGEVAGRYTLEDDPADHRGILSWFSQKRDGKLREAGSYGQLIRVPVPASALAAGARAGALTVRLEVGESLPGGLAIYGRRFGRYPVDPSVLFVLR
ncbi:MAG TPA: glycoside hydrolase family 2 TIM barrel-domain containing protein [Gemmatimonadaceae bacterium]|nr:glycoside hydrolase family 2 TIM barrel-domain containing protein [Gemmatimonadaceae bacterium]